MPSNVFAQFRNEHAHAGCSGDCWTFIEALWSSADSDPGGRAELVDKGSAHINGWYHVNGEETLVWMTYPGGATPGDYARFEVHFEKIRRRLAPDEDPGERCERAAKELRKVCSWRQNLDELPSRKICKLRLKDFRAEHAAPLAIEAVRILTSVSLPLME